MKKFFNKTGSSPPQLPDQLVKLLWQIGQLRIVHHEYIEKTRGVKEACSTSRILCSYALFFSVWRHVSGKIASWVAVRDESGVAGEGKVVVPKFHSWCKCAMPLTNINSESDWMSNASPGLCINLHDLYCIIYAGPLFCILGCKVHMSTTCLAILMIPYNCT